MNDKREKVIRGAECHKAGLYEECLKCPYHDDGCETTLCNDAIALLKEQEARVLTKDDFSLWIVSGAGCEIPVWTEFRDPACIHADIVCGMNDKRICFRQYYEDGARANEWEECGKKWRCWTARPTEEQMRDTPWEGDKEIFKEK